MANLQYSQTGKFRCDIHGYRGSSMWVMPSKDEHFIPFYTCLHCVIDIVGKNPSICSCSGEQLEAILRLKRN